MIRNIPSTPSELEKVPEAVGVGSAGCSTDSCLKTAYLSEDETEADEEPDTGVSMADALQETQSQRSG